MKQQETSGWEALAALATLGAGLLFVLATFALGLIELIQRAQSEPAWQMFLALGVASVVGATVIWLVGAAKGKPR